MESWVDVSLPTVKAWREGIPELARDYNFEQESTRTATKLPLDKYLIEKAKSKKRWEQS